MTEEEKLLAHEAKEFLRRKTIGQEVQVYKEYVRDVANVANNSKGKKSNVFASASASASASVSAPASNQLKEKKKIICYNIYFKNKRKFGIIFGTIWIS